MPIINLAIPNNVADFVLAFVFMALLAAFVYFLSRRWIAVLVIGVLEVISFIFYCVGLYYCWIAFTVLLAIALLLVFFVNLHLFRLIFASRGESNLLHFARRKKKKDPEILYDQDDFLAKLVTAVLSMSRLRRGALITIEKKDDILSDAKVGSIIRQKGVEINAPFVPELVETIFYEGTRLHDGAIVVKNGIIVRAAVFFVSTERPLDGKFGSRHQAAIGISENSDSVTVIVSEETGRIAIAFQGELTPVSSDNLLRVLEDDLAYQEDEEA